MFVTLSQFATDDLASALMGGGRRGARREAAPALEAGAVAPRTLREAHAGCKCVVHKRRCARPTTESAGAAIRGAMGTRDRVASAVSECLYACPPYGPRMRVPHSPDPTLAYQ